MSSTISTGSPSLDYVLQGGFRSGSITELCGESSSGKTQICLQATISAQLPTNEGGLHCSSLYIHSNGPFPVARLATLAEYRSKPTHIPINLLDNVKVRKVACLGEMLFLSNNIEQIILRSVTASYPVRLIVLDSIASTCRGQFPNSYDGMMARYDILRSIAYKLKSLAIKYNLVVIVTNDVSDVFTSNNNHLVNTVHVWSNGRQVQACLGSNWARHIDTRLFLTLQPCTHSNITQRFLHVNFSNSIPECYASFHICKEGVF